MKTYKHFSYEERCEIEDGLRNNISIYKIAKELDRSYSSLLREIKRHKVKYVPECFSIYSHNSTGYKPRECELLKESPYVCNGCSSKRGCRKIKFTYRAYDAEASYQDDLRNTRKGISLTPDEIDEINEVLTPLIKNGQTINHLYINHPEILDFSKVTFYHYVNEGIFKFGPLDFPRIVKYKKRKNNKTRRTKQERLIRINRTYEDFSKYIIENPDLNIVEMDTVIGSREQGPCFLTLMWRKAKFMLIFLLQSKTSSEVTRIFDELQNILSYEEYTKLFQVILTDNGSEFFDVANLETYHKTGEVITKVFYCDPHASRQKGMIEKNHEFIRYVLPKKTKFDSLTQKDCDIIKNNINSLCRDSLNGKSPYEAMTFICSESTLKSLGCYFISADEVQLNDNLLK